MFKAPNKNEPSNPMNDKDTPKRQNSDPSTQVNLFDIQNIRVCSGDKVLLQVDQLSIYKHRLTSFIGPNGAGKSTLLHSLLSHHSGLGLTTSGNIHSSIAPHKQMVSKGYIAWLGQHERFELPLSVMQYALLGVSPQLKWYQNPNQTHVNVVTQLLQDFELQQLTNARVQTLSGGEKQRLAIVRTLMQDTQILILDEPTNHLDIRHQRHLLKYLRRLVVDKHKTIIVVLHDLAHAYRYSDDVVLMDKGRIVTHGKPTDVMNKETLSAIYQVAIEPYDTGNGHVFV